MHPRDRHAVTGDADEADEPLVARFDGCLQRATLAERGLPLVRIDEVVQLQEVDVVDPEAVERPADLVAGTGTITLARLRRQEELVAVLREQWREPKLGVAVRRSGVDVIDALLEEQLEGRVGFRLRDRAQGRGAEDRARAVVPGAPERRSRDHPLSLAAALGSCARAP